MSFFDRFKTPVAPEPVVKIVEVEKVVQVDKIVEVEKIVRVESSDRDILKAILRELEIANELKVFKLNQNDVQRQMIAKMRGES